MNFVLNKKIADEILSRESKMNLIQQIVLNTQYLKKDENWNKLVIRCTEGLMTIRKRHYIAHRLSWDEDWYQEYAKGLAGYMFDMKYLPAGRKLRGLSNNTDLDSLTLNNCAAVSVKKGLYSLGQIAGDFYEMLSNGVGVGFDTQYTGRTISRMRRKLLCNDELSEKDMLMIYINSLIDNETQVVFQRYPDFQSKLEYLTSDCSQDKTRFVVDLFNKIGIIATKNSARGSVAEIAIGSINDETFKSLKDYSKYPERKSFGYISNNTVKFEETEDFKNIPRLAEMIKSNGEPGFLNMKNIHKYGRYGHETLPDKAFLCNPCGEIPLESYELCNLATTIPVNCRDLGEWKKALEYATFDCCTTSLLMTSNPRVNKVISRNRRIGVSISGIADWLYLAGQGRDLKNFECSSATKLVDYLRDGYKHVVTTANKLNEDAGVPKPIRYTTIKPEGTLGLLANVSPGIHFPVITKGIRRFALDKNSIVSKTLSEKEVPNSEYIYDKNRTIFDLPFKSNCTRSVDSVSAWEQFCLLALFQREYSDNMVSCTVTFDPSDNIENMIAYFMPVIKGVSLLPKNNSEYKQMPYEKCSKDYYKVLKKVSQTVCLEPGKSSSTRPDYCSNDTCSIAHKEKKV